VVSHEKYVTESEFKAVYEHADSTRAAIGDLITLISEREATRQANRSSRFAQRETANSNW